MASVCWEPRRAWGAEHLGMSGQCRLVSGLQDRWGLDGPQSACVSTSLDMCVLCVHVPMWALLCLPGHLRRLSDQRAGMQPPGLGRWLVLWSPESECTTTQAPAAPAGTRS